MNKKVVMAVTGLILFGFVVIHMLGNLQIFLGQDALNNYAKHLEELPYLLWPARFILLISLALHIGVAFRLTAENRKARSQAYVFQNTVQASYASRTMIFSGIIVFAFIVYHLLHFTFGVAHPQYFERVDAQGREDVYFMVVKSFGEWPIALTYIAAMALLSMHLSHGIQSLFQTLGFENARPFMKKAGFFAALIIFLGNSSIPIAVLLGAIHVP